MSFANLTPRFFGTWMVPDEILVPSPGSDKRFHVATDTHDGPAVQFPRGKPAIGDRVIVHVTADACLRRGEGLHRPRNRFVLRVVPFHGDLREWQGEISLTRDGPMDGANYRLGLDLWLHQDTLPGETPEKARTAATREGRLMPPVALTAPPSWITQK